MKKASLTLSVALHLCFAVTAQTLQNVTTNGNSTTSNIELLNSAYLNVNSGTILTGEAKISLNAAGTNVNSGYGLIQTSYHAVGYHAPLILNSMGGNVGIGTTAPVEKLSVSGNISLDRSRAIFFGGNVTTTGEYIYENPYGTINIHSGGQDAIVIPNNDNVYLTPNACSVGIGTKAPGPYKLAVEGVVGARKVKVTQVVPWADYVFDSSYQLAPLSHVEQFIRENKHLPEMPTAATVAREGLDVGDNQVLLLKKIEELTLYIIQQNKEMQVQNKEIQLMKEKIKALETGK